MVYDTITPEILKNTLYYNCWHPTGSEEGTQIDFNIAMPICYLTASNEESGLWLVWVHLVELIDLSDIPYVDNDGYRFWELPGIKTVIEDLETGIRYKCFYESMNYNPYNSELELIGNFSLFSDDFDECYVETWFKLYKYKQLWLNTSTDIDKFSIRFKTIDPFLKDIEPLIREHFPDKYYNFIASHNFL